MKKFLEFCLVACVSWYGITTGCPAFGGERKPHKPVARPFVSSNVTTHIQPELDDEGHIVVHELPQTGSYGEALAIQMKAEKEALREYKFGANGESDDWRIKSSAGSIESVYGLRNQKREPSKVRIGISGVDKNGNLIYTYAPRGNSSNLNFDGTHTTHYPDKGREHKPYVNPYNVYKYDENGKRIRTGW